MQRVLTFLLALGILLTPLGAGSHAMSVEPMPASDMSLAMSLAMADAAVDADCCESVQRTAPGTCKLDPGLLSVADSLVRVTSAVSFAPSMCWTPTVFDPTGLLDPPRSI